EYADLHGFPDPELREELTKRLKTDGLPELVNELKKRAPETAEATDLHNPVRVTRALEKVLQDSEPIKFSLPPYKKAKFILEPPPQALDEAITARIDAMFQAGWMAEVEGLLRQGVPPDASGLRAIGYDSVIGVVEGRLSLEDARLKIATETRKYAKRQRTWLRSEPNAVRIQMADVSDKSLREAATSIVDFANSMEHQNG
ncbi:MAG TPA: tRNA dimethylallyltransferase, partial [Fimbriimonadaceae bacterium]|nr:tRNA dimethylallyltransferase [Fimbriimonadaceae bacterium]